MKTLLLVVLLLLLACGTYGAPEPTRPTDRNAREVRTILYFGSRYQWERTPWFRLHDDLASWPSRVVLATDDTTCLLSDGDVYEPLPRQFYQCKTSWRLPRAW